MKRFETTLGLSFCLLLSFGCLMSISGQRDIDSFYTEGGTLISELNTRVSSDEFNLVGYRLEVVDLPVSKEEKNDVQLSQRAFRIVVVSARPLLKMELYSVWFGELNQLDAYLTKPNELSAVIFARTLPSGDVSIGLSKRGKQSPDKRLIFPGTLYVPPEYATPVDQLETAPVIVLKRLPRTIQIRVEFARGGCFDSMTGTPRYSSIEIEGFEMPRGIVFMCGGDGNDFVGHFLPEEFARIPNGANIIKAVVNGRNVSRTVVGRLDKNSVQ